MLFHHTVQKNEVAQIYVDNVFCFVTKTET
jgi:hypothetical protein